MSENSSIAMPPFFRTTDVSSFVEHIYRRPDELIGFADMLMRWPSLSFFKVPFFTVMRRVGEDVGFYLHLYEAVSIAFADVQPDGVSETTLEPEYEEDGSRKARGKNAKSRRKTAAELEADRMHVYLRIQSPLHFRLRFEHLYDSFDKLYFLRSEVEAVEKAFPECRITSPLQASKDSRYFGLYLTTEENIAEVAHQTLNRMANCIPVPVQHSNTFRDGLLDPDSGMWWTDRGGAAPVQPDDLLAQLREITENNGIDAQWEKAKELSASRNVNPIALLPVLPMERIWPDVPVTLPENPKKSRNAALKDIWPKLEVLKRLGVRDKKKLAKIIYGLHPYLSDMEIGALLPARHGIQTSNETKRQWGRELLGKKVRRKPTDKATQPHTSKAKPPHKAR